MTSRFSTPVVLRSKSSLYVAVPFASSFRHARVVDHVDAAGAAVVVLAAEETLHETAATSFLLRREDARAPNGDRCERPQRRDVVGLGVVALGRARPVVFGLLRAGGEARGECDNERELHRLGLEAKDMPQCARA
jgi:hypothetical protein